MEATHYIFVDFENVQSVDLSLVAGKPVQVILVVGKTQNKVGWDLVDQLSAHHAQVRRVKVDFSGDNALDFVLACEMGGMCATQPHASYHIVSKDKGFDAVVKYLTGHKIRVARHESFAAVPILGGAAARAEKAAVEAVPAAKAAGTPPPGTTKKETPATLEGRVAVVREGLGRCPKSRPAREKSLLAWIDARFKKELPEPEVKAVLKSLVSQKAVVIDAKGKLTYRV